MKRFREGLVFKAHRLSYHSTLGSRVIKKKMKGKWLYWYPRIQQSMLSAGVPDGVSLSAARNIIAPRNGSNRRRRRTSREPTRATCEKAVSVASGILSTYLEGVSGFRFPVLDFRLRVSGFSGSGFRASDFRCRVSSFG